MKLFVVYSWVNEKNRHEINMYKTTIFKHHIFNNRIVVVYSIQYSMYVCGCAMRWGCLFFSSNDNSLSRMAPDMYILEFIIIVLFFQAHDT